MFIQNYSVFCLNKQWRHTLKVLKIISFDSLSFKLRHGASYVTDRRSVTYFPQSGNSYSPAGVKVMKMILTGNSWMDPSTVKLFMIITNDSAAEIKPDVAGAWGMFRRLRILCGGQIVENIDLYGRLHEQFHMMTCE